MTNTPTISKIQTKRGCQGIMADPFADNDDEIPKHHCKLGPQARHHIDIVKTQIDTGLFVELRRKLRRCTMVNKNHPHTPFLIRSTYELLLEEKRQLLLYPYMIHPFSMFALWYNLIMVLLYMYIYVIFTVLFVVFHDLATMHQLYYIATPFYVPLIIISFLTGYHDIHENRIILRFRSVLFKYVSTYLLFDVLFLSCIAIFIIYYDYAQIYSFLSFSILPACAFARYPYFLRGMKLFKMYCGIEMNTYHCLRIFIMAVTLLLFIFAYLFYGTRKVPWDYILINRPPKTKKVLHWLQDLERLFAFTEVIVTAGQAHVNLLRHTFESDYTTELVPIIFIPVGFVCQMWLAVKLMQAWNNYYINEGRNDSMHLQFKTYMRYKAIPVKLQKKISMFLDFKYQKQLFEEQKINALIPDKLRREIVLDATRSKLDQVEFFKRFPEKVLKKLLVRMELEISMPGDLIIKAGATGTCMFFISVGTVSVTTRGGREVCVLRDGAHFGEIALITKTSRVANVTAVTLCEMYRLKSKHFQQVMERYPELLEELRDTALGRIAKTKSVMKALKSTSQSLGNLQSKANLDEDSDSYESEEDILHLL